MAASSFPRSVRSRRRIGRPGGASRVRPRLLGRRGDSIATKSNTCRSRAAWSPATATCTTSYVNKGPVEPFGRAPGYPVFLALTGGGAAESVHTVPASVKVAQSVVGAIGVVAHRARRISHGRPSIGDGRGRGDGGDLSRRSSGWQASRTASRCSGRSDLALALIVSHTLEERARRRCWKLGAVVRHGRPAAPILFRAATSALRAARWRCGSSGSGSGPRSPPCGSACSSC